MKRINKLVNILVVLLMIVSASLLIPKVFGFSIYSVLSDSMEPTLSIGSLVYVKKVNPQTLTSQDIISFYGQGNKVVTHRITNIENNIITTKGDHNDDVDMTKLNMTNVIGKVTFSIPILGFIYQIIGNISGITGLFIILMFIMILCLYSYHKRRKKR